MIQPSNIDPLGLGSITGMQSSCSCKQHQDGNGASAFDNCLTGKSLAMVYSPCQEFAGIYAPEEALCRGTIFMELEKPFYGARRLK